MNKTCKNCGKVVDRHTKNYCRACFILLGTKTKRNCPNCGNPLSLSGAYQGNKYCRSCHWKLYSRRHKTYLNKEWLIENYINKKLSLEKCAKLANCGSTTIQIWLQRFGIIPLSGWVKDKINKEKNLPPIRKTMNRGYIYLYVGKDGITVSDRGYLKIPEHKWIMEQHLGRKLNPFEKIHHLNGIKTDNRIENLMLFPNDAEHQKFERKYNFFVKQLMWSNLNLELKDKLHNLFTDFLSKFG